MQSKKRYMVLKHTSIISRKEYGIRHILRWRLGYLIEKQWYACKKVCFQGRFYIELEYVPLGEDSINPIYCKVFSIPYADYIMCHQEKTASSLQITCKVDLKSHQLLDTHRIAFIIAASFVIRKNNIHNLTRKKSRFFAYSLKPLAITIKSCEQIDSSVDTPNNLKNFSPSAAPTQALPTAKPGVAILLTYIKVITKHICHRLIQWICSW